jgi:spore coat protein CotH
LLASSPLGADEPKKAEQPKKPDNLPVGADVFGPEKVWQFHLTLTAAEYAAMQPAPGTFPDGPGGFPGGPMPPPKVELKPGEPKRDAHRSAFGIEFPWVVASLTLDGKTIEKVGLRYKGNSTYVRASRNLKRSLKVDIDRHDEAARFHGLKSFTLSNGVMDPSKSREALAYSIYRAAGVPAPRTAFAEVTLTVAGKYDKEHVGLYTLIEAVDKSFLKLNFKNNAGLLMKPERIPGLVYFGEDWARYKNTYLPKREATKDEVKRVIDFTKLVNATPDAQFNEEIASYLDVDGFLKFMAVTAIVANFDSFHGGHNYFLYLHPETNKFHFIPWDLDLALGGFPMLGAAEQMDLSLTKPYAGQSKLANRLMANKEYADKYRQVLKEVVPLCFAKEKLLTEIAVIEKMVKPLIEREMTASAARKENAGGLGGPGDSPGGMGRFGHPAADLKTFVEKRSESIAAQLTGKSKGFTPVGFGPPGDGRPNPAEAGRQLTETLGPPFLVFRDKVQEELKLSDEQKKKLEKRLQDTVQNAMQFFQRLGDGDKKQEDREKGHHAYVEKAQENLTAFLEGVLKEEQFKRLRQVMLQREGLFALGNAEVMQELEVTDKQRQQFVEVVQEMQKMIGPLLKEAQKAGKPEEIRPKVMKIREEHVGRIEALLSDAQKAQWKKMLGKPLDLGD